jgi:hypothetical protein
MVRGKGADYHTARALLRLATQQSASDVGADVHVPPLGCQYHINSNHTLLSNSSNLKKLYGRVTALLLDLQREAREQQAELWLCQSPDGVGLPTFPAADPAWVKETAFERLDTMSHSDASFDDSASPQVARCGPSKAEVNLTTVGWCIPVAAVFEDQNQSEIQKMFPCFKDNHLMPWHVHGLYDSAESAGFWPRVLDTALGQIL